MIIPLDADDVPLVGDIAAVGEHPIFLVDMLCAAVCGCAKATTTPSLFIELKLPEEKVDPWGGAIALGHPMGATGCVLTCKALDYLKETGGKYALITMCIGGGMGAAGIMELL